MHKNHMGSKSGRMYLKNIKKKQKQNHFMFFEAVTFWEFLK